MVETANAWTQPLADLGRARAPPPPAASLWRARRIPHTSEGLGQGGDHPLEGQHAAGGTRGVEHHLVVGARHQVDQGGSVVRPYGQHAVDALGPVRPAAVELDADLWTTVVGAQRPDAAAGHDPPGLDDGDLVAEALDEVELMAREHHRHAAGTWGPQHFLQQGAPRVEAVEGSSATADRVRDQAAQLDPRLLPWDSVSARSSPLDIPRRRPLARGLHCLRTRMRTARRSTRPGRAGSCAGRGPAPRACSRSADGRRPSPERPSTGHRPGRRWPTPARGAWSWSCRSRCGRRSRACVRRRRSSTARRGR